jgi:hypothetical protein
LGFADVVGLLVGAAGAAEYHLPKQDLLRKKRA